MVHSNKILTVSYGTFSCTLEGFDDSFGTMKAIAEYFRDLASDDRYFGAEPPVPDADMLARIAQREISRRVEARQDEGGGFVLRAGEMQAEPKALEGSPSDADEATPTQPPSDIENDTRETTADDEARAQTISAVSEPAPYQPKPAITPFQDTETDDECEAVLPDRTTGTSLLDAVTGKTDAKDDVPLFEAELVEPVTREAESIAAKLQRIRDVVARSEQRESSAAADGKTRAQDYVDAVAQDLTMALNRDVPSHDAPQEDQDQEDEILLALSRLESPLEAIEGTDTDRRLDEHGAMRQSLETPAFEEDKAPAVDPENAHPDLPEDPGAQPVSCEEESSPGIEKDPVESPHEGVETGFDQHQTDQAAHVDLSRDKPDLEDNADDEDFDEQTAPESLAADSIAPVKEIRTDSTSETTPDELADTPYDTVPDAPMSRVIKVKRTDFEAAVSTGAFEDMDSADATPEEETSNETDLRQALEQLADDITAIGMKAETDPEEHAASPETKDATGDDEPRAVNSMQQDDVKNDDDDDDVSRLMAEIDEQMDTVEATDARETHNKLRGAVVAAESDNSSGGPIADGKPEDDYREDLADIIRPRRPVASAKSADRPISELRPAPLRLVPEQRIDLGTACVKHGPVRPRRVASSDRSIENGGSADATFAEFVSEMNAEELPDILEAAAAYLIFVEGRAQFSRPQLMNKVRQVDAVAFNREDSLRSFGRLLRDGKIEKTGGGRFTASGEIGFRPDEHVSG